MRHCEYFGAWVDAECSFVPVCVTGGSPTDCDCGSDGLPARGGVTENPNTSHEPSPVRFFTLGKLCVQCLQYTRSVSVAFRFDWARPSRQERGENSRSAGDQRAAGPPHVKKVDR